MIKALIGSLGGPYIAIALAAILAFAGVQTVRVSLVKADLAREQMQRANERAAAAQALAIEQARVREIEQRWQAKVDDERKGISNEQQKNATLVGQIAPLRDAAALVPGLRDQLAAARRSASKAATDALLACDARASTYEQVLAEGDRVVARVVGSLGSCRAVAGESALAHDDRASEVTGLVKSWP